MKLTNEILAPYCEKAIKQISEIPAAIDPKERTKKTNRIKGQTGAELFLNLHKDNINKALQEEIDQRELPEGSLYLDYNLGVDVPTFSVYIYEPEYPLVEKENRTPQRNTKVLNIETNFTVDMKKGGVKSTSLNLNIYYDQFDFVVGKVGLEHWGIEKELSGTGCRKVRIPMDSDMLIPLLKECVDYSVRNYESKATRFGCCSHFMECSDAKHCVHPNKLYACACYYKANLDQGKIFYGVNKNVD